MSYLQTSFDLSFSLTVSQEEDVLHHRTIFLQAKFKAILFRVTSLTRTPMLIVNMAVDGQPPAAGRAHDLFLPVRFVHMCSLGSCQPYLHHTEGNRRQTNPWRLIPRGNVSVYVKDYSLSF